jgi:hypothetical protein
MSGISFNAIINKITTTIDGGWRVTFDVAQSDASQIFKLSEIRDQAVQVGVLTTAMAIEIIDQRKKK